MLSIVFLMIAGWLASCSGMTGYTAIEKNSRSALDSKDVLPIPTAIDQISNKLAKLTIESSDGPTPIGVSKSIKVVGIFVDGTSKDVSALAKWSISPENLATVKNIGTQEFVIVGSGSGTVELRVSLGDIAESKYFNFYPARIESIKITPENSAFPAGGSGTQFKATASFDDGSNFDVTNDVTWISSNSAADISAAGMPKGFLRGINKCSDIGITAIMGGVSSNRASYTVLEHEVVSIHMQCDYAKPMFAGCVAVDSGACPADSGRPSFISESQNVNTYAYYSDCKSAVILPTRLESDKNNIVSVGNKDSVSFLAEGRANIKAVLNVGSKILTSDDTKVFDVTIPQIISLRFPSQPRPAVPSYCPMPSESTDTDAVADAGGMQFKVLGYYSNCYEGVIAQNVVWSSSDETVGKFSATKNGYLVYGTKSGKINVTAKIGNLTAYLGNIEINPCLGKGGTGLFGLVYKLTEGTATLPNYDNLTPIGRTIYKNSTSGPKQSFTSGVNGMEEYYGIRLMGKIDIDPGAKIVVATEDGYSLSAGGRVLCESRSASIYRKIDTCATYDPQSPVQMDWFQGIGRVEIGMFGVNSSMFSFKYDDLDPKYRNACLLQDFNELK